MPKIIKHPVVSYVVEVKCDCGSYMDWDGLVLTSYPPQYKHICKDCGKTVTLDTRAGNLVYDRL